jgi:hypothetical protein
MKNLRFMAILFISVALLASPVWGQVVIEESQIDISAARGIDPDVDAEPSGPVVVGWEWLQDIFDDFGPDYYVSVDLGNALPRPCEEPERRSNLIYVSAVDIPESVLMTFKVCGGMIELAGNPNYALYNLNEDRVVANLVDYGPDPDDPNCQLLKFKFTFCCDPEEGMLKMVKQGHRLALLENNNPPRRGNRPTLLFNNETLNENNGIMTIEVSEALDDTGVELLAPTTGPETIVKLFDKNQLFARVEYREGGSSQQRMKEGFATATIDLYANPSRTKFVREGSDTRVDTGMTTSTKAEILVVDAGYNGHILVDGVPYGNINYGFRICDATYNMQIAGPYQVGIIDVALNTIDNSTGNQIPGTPFFRNADPWDYWSVNSSFAANDLREALENDVRMTISGNDPMDPALYLVNLEVTPFETGQPILLLNKEDTTSTKSHAFHWSVNGQQVRIPYILIEAGGTNYTSWISIANRMSQKAEVFAKAIVSNEDNTINQELSFSHAIEVVEPTSVTIIMEDRIAELIGSPVSDGGIWRCALTLYIATKDDLSDVTAWQISPDGRCQIPVLYDLKLPYPKGRDWVQ